MRRTITIGAALAVLAGTGVAFAAAGFNNYKATENFCKTTPSSPTVKTCAPAVAKGPVSLTEHWQASGNSDSGNSNARPITKIVVKNYGVKTNGAAFPTCTATQINNAGNAKNWNAVCPKGSLIGGGPVSAELLASSGTGAPGQCHPYLFVYNGGKSTQTFLFAVSPQAPGPQYTCSGSKTGTSCAAYTGKVAYTGGYGVTTINVPPCASTQAAGLTGVYASLHTLDVNYPDKTKGKGGVTYLQSVACKGSSRPYSTTFTAAPFTTPPGQKPETTTVSGTSKC